MTNTDQPDRALETLLRERLNAGIADVRPLSGGCVADVSLVELADARRVVVKRGETAAVEAMMLRELAERSALPVPAVLAESDGVLVMEHVEHGGGLDEAAQRDAAEHLAALHAVTPNGDERANGAFGFRCDTLIGSLKQRNGWREEWHAFFRDERLVYMAGLARDAGRLGERLYDEVRRFAESLTDEDCPPPAGGGGPVGRLLHGDCWGGNVLASPGGGRIAAFIDPAIYFGHPEVELAFSTLFGTFGRPFFERYAQTSDAVEDWDGFWSRRRDLYNLYPLLVHVRLFGGGYVSQLETTLRKVRG